MVYTCAVWKALESKKDGNKVNVLWNNERSAVVLDHFRNFKDI